MWKRWCVHFCSIFPSPEPAGVQSGVVHVPIPCSTGSLPNLSDLNFSLPLTVPIDVDSACCGPGGAPLPNYSVADTSTATQTGQGTVPLRLNRQMVPVPLVLLGGQNPPNEVCCIAVLLAGIFVTQTSLLATSIDYKNWWGWTLLLKSLEKLLYFVWCGS